MNFDIEIDDKFCHTCVHCDNSHPIENNINYLIQDYKLIFSPIYLYVIEQNRLKV